VERKTREGEGEALTKLHMLVCANCRRPFVTDTAPPPCFKLFKCPSCGYNGYAVYEFEAKLIQSVKADEASVAEFRIRKTVR